MSSKLKYFLKITFEAIFKGIIIGLIVVFILKLR